MHRLDIERDGEYLCDVWQILANHSWVMNMPRWNFKYNSLGFLIKFKYIVVWTLVVIENNIIVYIVLVNTVVCLNLIDELKVHHLSNSINFIIKLKLFITKIINLKKLYHWSFTVAKGLVAKLTPLHV